MPTRSGCGAPLATGASLALKRRSLARTQLLRMRVTRKSE
jgi:hypothetical protein